MDIKKYNIKNICVSSHTRWCKNIGVQKANVLAKYHFLDFDLELVDKISMVVVNFNLCTSRSTPWNYFNYDVQIYLNKQITVKNNIRHTNNVLHEMRFKPRRSFSLNQHVHKGHYIWDNFNELYFFSRSAFFIYENNIYIMESGHFMRWLSQFALVINTNDGLRRFEQILTHNNFWEKQLKLKFK